MSETADVFIEVPWNGDDIELRAMGAIIEVFRRSRLDGMDREAQRRVAAYFAERLRPAPSMPGSFKDPTQS